MDSDENWPKVLLPAMAAPLSNQTTIRPSAARPTTVEEIDSADRLARLAPEWERLFAACPQATPFQSAEWLLPWLATFGADGLWALAARRGDRLVGLLLLQLGQEPSRPTLGLLGRGISDYGGALIAPGPDGTGVARAFFDRVAERRDRWELFVLDQLPPNDPLYAAPLPGSLVEEWCEQDVCPYLPLPPSSAELLRTLPHRLGPRIERSLRRLHREGQARFESATAENLEEILDALFRLHTVEWNARAQPGVLADPALQAFHRQVAAGMLARGRLRLHALRVDGRVEAVLYAFRHGSRLYSYLSGFGPRLVALSPGTLMIWRAISTAIEESATVFDFLRGDEPYKFRWGAHPRWNRRRILRAR